MLQVLAFHWRSSPKIALIVLAIIWLVIRWPVGRAQEIAHGARLVLLACSTSAGRIEHHLSGDGIDSNADRIDTVEIG